MPHPRRRNPSPLPWKISAWMGKAKFKPRRIPARKTLLTRKRTVIKDLLLRFPLLLEEHLDLMAGKRTRRHGVRVWRLGLRAQNAELGIHESNKWSSEPV